MKRKIAIGLCIFLTIAPFLGSHITNEKVGLFIGNLFPYVHLSIPEAEGLPFADGIASLLGLLISMFSLLGFIIFIVTKRRNVIGLKAFLVITIIYCGLRVFGGVLGLFISGFIDIPLVSIAGIISDFVWGFFCYWAGNNINTSTLKAQISKTI